jgi:hypothetical protein
MKEGTCETCEGSGRQKWYPNKGLLSVRRGDGKEMGPAGKWIPADKDEIGDGTRACETCKGSPAFAAKQLALAAAAAPQSPTVSNSSESNSSSTKMCTRCQREVTVHRCPSCYQDVCDNCSYPDGNCQAHG